MNKYKSLSIYINNTYIDCVDLRIFLHLIKIYNCFSNYYSIYIPNSLH